VCVCPCARVPCVCVCVRVRECVRAYVNMNFFSGPGVHLLKTIKHKQRVAYIYIYICIHIRIGFSFKPNPRHVLNHTYWGTSAGHTHRRRGGGEGGGHHLQGQGTSASRHTSRWSCSQPNSPSPSTPQNGHSSRDIGSSDVRSRPWNRKLLERGFKAFLAPTFFLRTTHEQFTCS
jgi:hypothetical protein